jgi:hypothetical protein
VWGKPAKRGFIGHSGEYLQQQSKLKTLTNFQQKVHISQQKNHPAVGCTPSKIWPCTAGGLYRPMYDLYRFSLLYDLFAGAGMACKQPSWLRKFGLNLAYSSLLAAVLKWPLFAAQNDLCWLPKLGPELALSASAAPSASPAQAPSSSHLHNLTNENACPTPPSPLLLSPFSPHLP